MKKTLTRWLRQHGLSLAVFAVIAGLLLSTLPSVVSNSREETLRLYEDVLRRTVVSCYALEGRYPPDLEYLSRVDGLTLQEDRYIVQYEIFAENVMPEITVLER